MIYLKNPLCLGMEESEYKEMLALGGMRQKHFEKNEVILSAGCTTHEIGLHWSGPAACARRATPGTPSFFMPESKCMLWAWCCAAPSTSKISTCGAAKAF